MSDDSDSKDLRQSRAKSEGEFGPAPVEGASEECPESGAEAVYGQAVEPPPLPEPEAEIEEDPMVECYTEIEESEGNASDPSNENS